MSDAGAGFVGTRGRLHRIIYFWEKASALGLRLLTFWELTRGWWFRASPARGALARAVLGLALAE